MRHRFATLGAVLALVACVAWASFAQGDPAPETWRVFESAKLKQQKAWKTDDWNDYEIDEIPYPAYSFAYPAEWKFNGYSVFVTSTDVKVAELAPGVV